MHKKPVKKDAGHPKKENKHAAGLTTEQTKMKLSCLCSKISSAKWKANPCQVNHQGSRHAIRHVMSNQSHCPLEKYTSVKRVGALMISWDSTGELWAEEQVVI